MTTTAEKLARDLEIHLNHDHHHISIAEQAARKDIDDLADRIRILEAEIQELRNTLTHMRQEVRT